MNAGVSIAPCAVVKRPCRAFDSRSWARSSNIFSMRRETSRNRAAKQIQTQNILCGLGFPLYIRASPHQALASDLRYGEGFFFAVKMSILAAVYLDNMPQIIQFIHYGL